ncbi:MAG: hypothetical protein RID23_08100 [Roseovarius sp.]
MRLTAPAQQNASAEAATGRLSDTESPRIDRLLELVSHPLTWAADYLDDSAALPALPLVFWLTDIFRPDAVLTVGGTTGTAHLAFCQAANRLNLTTRCCNGDSAATGVPAFDTARAAYGGNRSVPIEAEVNKVKDFAIIAVNLSCEAARRDSDMARVAPHIDTAAALLLYGPGLSEGLVAGIKAPDRTVMVFGQSAPQMALVLAPGAASPLSQLAALPADSAERRAFDTFLDRQGRMHRLDLMARGAGPRPLETTRDIAPPPSRHSEDVERLLAKLLELEEDRITLRRNRPEPLAAEPEPSAVSEAGDGFSLSDRLHDMEAEIAFLQQRVQQSERQLRDTLASTSWRITAPLRLAVRAVRRLLRR